MKLPRLIAGLALAAIPAFGVRFSTAFAQGNLTPPGPPAPTMKTLAQIEPRTPISSAPFTITQPGSYYLATNLTVTTAGNSNAIVITANGVTLDLAGFDISSTVPSATGTAILLAGSNADITIINGHISSGVIDNAGSFSGSGFANGIDYSSTEPVNVRVTGVSVSGCLNYGIFIGLGFFLSSPTSVQVDSCVVQTVGGIGITATSVLRSSAFQCGSFGIFADTASDCVGLCAGNDDGVYAVLTANNCYGSGADNGDGIDALTANNCYGASAYGDGVNATTAINCYGTTTGGGAGVNATSASNCYGSNANGTGEGLYSLVAIGCFGSSSIPGTGLYASHIAMGCFGLNNSAGGVGLYAYVGNSSYGVDGNSVVSESILYKNTSP